MSEVVEDRVSNLPGSILHHILSFVDTRDAARTSVLSKRWKYIWRSIPILEFDYQNSSKVDKLVDFIDRTLELHDESNIQIFSLTSTVLSNESRVRKWITTLISHNVEDLTLQFTTRHPVSMPPSLFTCESLIKLRLYSGTIICSPRYVSFPRLERFLLFGVLFKDECWNDQLFSNCPVLQFLFLGCCTWSSGMENVCISNPSLRKLVISNWEHQDGFQNCALKIDAPSLESLTYKGILAKDYNLSSFPSLVEAHIDLFYDVYKTTWEQAVDYGAVVSKFLQALADVDYLTISDRTLQVITIAEDLWDHIPSYSNLSELCVTDKVIADEALIVLLEKAPNLESLKFKKFVPSFPGEKEDDTGDAGDDGSDDIDHNEAAEDEDYSDNEDDCWGLDMVSTRLSFVHLKFVSFNKFTGKAWEMRWLKLILKKAKALVIMTISCDHVSHMKNENIMADITSLPRASASCVFKFSPKQG